MSFRCCSLQKKLPTFCYLCGMVGHGSNSSNCWNSDDMRSSYPTPCSDPNGRQGSEVRTTRASPTTSLDACNDHQPPVYRETSDQYKETPKTDFGPWMLVSKRKGRGEGHSGARGGSGRPNSRAAHASSTDPNNDNSNVPMP